MMCPRHLLREWKNLRRTGCADAAAAAAAAARVTQYACCASHNIPPSTFQSGLPDWGGKYGPIWQPCIPVARISIGMCCPLKSARSSLIYRTTHVSHYRSNNVKHNFSRGDVKRHNVCTLSTLGGGVHQQSFIWTPGKRERSVTRAYRGNWWTCT